MLHCQSFSCPGDTICIISTADCPRPRSAEGKKLKAETETTKRAKEWASKGNMEELVAAVGRGAVLNDRRGRGTMLMHAVLREWPEGVTYLLAAGVAPPTHPSHLISVTPSSLPCHAQLRCMSTVFIVLDTTTDHPLALLLPTLRRTRRTPSSEMPTGSRRSR